MATSIETASKKPLYRLRLFLSVDLVGSTAFKSRESETNLVWIKAFQKFYEQFPKLFENKYKEFCAKSPELNTAETSYLPKVWKTIGDEILFVNRVYSIAHLAAYIAAFRDALIAFGTEVKASYQLNTKGNAWIAAFPTPNRSIHLALNPTDSPNIGNDDILTEADEAAVDEKPSNFDFLGKGIDGGFRISRNSTVDTMTLSPALAYLLCRARKNVETTKFECAFSFQEPQVFKGVLAGNKYPVISLITSRDEYHARLEDLEAKLLNRARIADVDVLQDYLTNYIEVHKVEKPSLKLTYNSADVAAPDFYDSYIQEWEKDLKSVKQQTKAEEEAALSSEPDEQSNSAADENLVNKLVDDLKKQMNVEDMYIAFRRANSGKSTK